MLEHIGIAVDDPDAVAALYEDLLGIHRYKQESIEREGVRTHFLPAGAAKLELLEALDPTSPVAKYLETHGEGLHHLAFEVDDIHAAFQRVQERGFQPIGEPPRPGADDTRIFFLHPKQTHGVLIEFCQHVRTPLAPTLVPCPNGRIAAYSRGTRQQPSLAVLHGIGGSTMLELEPLIHRLEPHHHVLALDFAAHGASDDFAGEPLSFDLFADNVLAVLDHFDVPTAHLFGFSMGGGVALHLAAHHPERVHRLAVHATNPYWDDELAAAMCQRLDPAFLADQSSTAHRLADAHGETRWEARFERFRRFVRTLPALHPSSDITAPALVSAFDQDDLFDLERTLRLYRQLLHARLALLPGTRHTLRHLDLALYTRLLTSWLNGDDG